jgi:hypothetical protein
VSTAPHPPPCFVPVVPRDSAWFSFFDGKDTVAIQDQPIYKEVGVHRTLGMHGARAFSSPHTEACVCEKVCVCVCFVRGRA